ncbi:type IV fimbrial biogenesis protein PilY1 [Psychrobacter sp. JCM 18902]|nr:type IV fimbrial biogenesis protein PilY1 [Psychrobacter sp. JCM 18902]
MYRKGNSSGKISLVIYNRMPKLAADGSIMKDDDGNSIMVPDLGNIKETINYTPEGCTSGSTIRFSRIERLKLALIELIADKVNDKNGNLKPTGTLADDYAIGVGAFSYNSDGRSAYVLSPTRVLTPDQRIELINQIKGLVANGGTPTAPALAESGAYMMGTTTIDDVKVVAERRYIDNKTRYRRCNGNENTLSYDAELKIHVYKCNNWGDWSTSSRVLPSYKSNSNIYHDDGGITYFAGDNSYSSFAASVATSKEINTNKNVYISPLNDDECSGNGIYLLTDGEPSNNIEDADSISIMNKSLTGSSLSMNSCDNSSSTGLSGSSEQGWGCMATYSQLLRNPANPGKLPIKTATVGFGKTFAGLTGTRSIIINGKQKEVIDCESGRSVKKDTRNLCKLGERKGDNEVKTFGDGGFYYTEESSEIAASVVDFASGLVQIINTAPSGTITIPEDPYRASNQLPYAYLPMLDPEIVSANSIWRGNLKKYNLDQGTLFGKNNSKLYKDIAGDLDENTQDVWQEASFSVEGKTANNDIAAGGVYAQLQAPSGGLGSVRTIYVEDYTSSSNKTPILRKLTVNGSGKPVGFDALVDTVAYSQINQRRLLSFLGFDGVLTNDGQPTTPLTTLTKNLTLTKPINETKVLGGVVHSKPEAISYGSALDNEGNIVTPREDYVLFGSMDGALHLVDAEDGKEEVAIIPRQMLINQSEALVSGSFKADIGQPYFGVDAPWLVKTDYNYDLAGKRVTVDTTSGKGMFAYGGLRMGGEALYGMNITNKSTPKILFTITSQGVSSTTAGKSATTGFDRLGQIWSKPVAAKIRLTKGSSTTKNTAPTDVLIFGGGYDMGYEEDDYVPTLRHLPRVVLYIWSMPRQAS